MKQKKIDDDLVDRIEGQGLSVNQFIRQKMDGTEPADGSLTTIDQRELEALRAEVALLRVKASTADAFQQEALELGGKLALSKIQVKELQTELKSQEHRFKMKLKVSSMGGRKDLDVEAEPVDKNGWCDPAFQRV